MKNILTIITLLIMVVTFAQNKLSGNWKVSNFNGTIVPADRQNEEIWNFYDYNTKGAYFSVPDEYGIEKMIEGSGTLYGKFHNQEMSGNFHLESGSINVIFYTALTQLVGGVYEYKATYKIVSDQLVLDGALCTNMGNGCGAKQPLKLIMAKIK